MQAHALNGGPKIAPAEPAPADVLPAISIAADTVQTALGPMGAVLILRNGTLAQMFSAPLDADNLTAIIDKLTECRRQLLGLVDPSAGKLVVPGQ